MSLMLLSPPAAEPVTLAEVKAHLRVDLPDEDALITGLAVAARHAVEARGQIALIAQAWRFALDAPPVVEFAPFGAAGAGDITAPLSPVASIDAVSVVDKAGATKAVDPALFETAVGATGRVRALSPWPAPGRKLDGVRIDFTAGFPDAASVPDDLKQAVMFLAAHFYENREKAQSERIHSIPDAVDALIAPYRRVRL
ncbi:MAG: head-tail connector protein [Parvularculaceae bacterium]